MRGAIAAGGRAKDQWGGAIAAGGGAKDQWDGAKAACVRGYGGWQCSLGYSYSYGNTGRCWSPWGTQPRMCSHAHQSHVPTQVPTVPSSGAAGFGKDVGEKTGLVP